MTVAQAHQRSIPFPFDFASPQIQERTALPGHEEIERRAYAIHIANGRVAGHQVHDWLQAETELRKQQRIAVLRP